jgi:hypothetical protein
MPAVFVITDDRKVRKLDRDDPRFDWKWPHTPPGMVRLQLRGKDRWRYVYHGPTPAEAVRNFNDHDMRKIAVLESQLANLRANLLRIDEPGGKG